MRHTVRPRSRRDCDAWRRFFLLASRKAACKFKPRAVRAAAARMDAADAAWARAFDRDWAIVVAGSRG